MGVIVDLILIAILLAFMIIGYVRGLAGSLIKLASFAIAVVLAVMLYKPISNVIMEKTQIDEKIETTERAIERTSHTNLSYSIIPCRAANAKLPAAVRHGNDTVFLFLSEFFKLLVVNFF